ncbi:hypothetical protein NL676_011241 [Syzygium grande]|nr:hypothetical protein NL676_011241 [Syzygium grande]
MSCTALTAALPVAISDFKDAGPCLDKGNSNIHPSLCVLLWDVHHCVRIRQKRRNTEHNYGDCRGRPEPRARINLFGGVPSPFIICFHIHYLLALRALLLFSAENAVGGYELDPQTLSPGLPENGFATSFDRATEATLQRFILPETIWKFKKWLGLGMEVSLSRSLEDIDAYLSDIISTRKQELASQQQVSSGSGPEHDDLLSRFMKKKESYSDKFLQHVALNFILAGRDTSSVALSWFFWLVSRNPRVEEKILIEICTVLLDTRGRDPAKWVEEPLVFEEVDRLIYLKAALSETLRLYPSVPEDSKHVVADDVLPSGVFVPAGSSITYSIYSIGRMEFIWGPDCLEFKPERWLSSDGKRTELQDSYKFVSFNAGPRLCLGKDLAYLQMKSVVAAVLLRHQLTVAPGHQVEQKMSLTLFMKYGLKMNVHQRDLRPILAKITKNDDWCGKAVLSNGHYQAAGEVKMVHGVA